jgi:hypothetical protein
VAPRFEHTNKDITPIETDNPREIIDLRRDGWKESVARTAEGREADLNTETNMVPAPKAPKAPKANADEADKK